MQSAAEYVIAKGLSVRETEEYVKKLLAPPKAPRRRRVNRRYTDAEEKMSRSLSTKVNNIRHTAARQDCDRLFLEGTAGCTI